MKKLRKIKKNLKSKKMGYLVCRTAQKMRGKLPGKKTKKRENQGKVKNGVVWYVALRRK